MTDTTQTIETTEPAPAPASEPLSPDLQFLKDHGEDITDFLPKAEEQPAQADKPAEPAPKEEDAEPGEVRIGDDGKVRDAKGRFVPLRALHDERGKRQTLESEANKLREEAAVLRTKLELATKAPVKAEEKATPANPFEEADIDPNADLLGAVNQERRRNAWLREQHATATQATQQQLTEHNVVQAYRDDTNAFLAKQPDYPKAFEHVVRQRAAELIALGVTDRAAITKQIRDDEADIVRQAIAAGRSPAQAFYSLAVARGYQAPTAAPTAPAAPAKPAEPTPAERQIEAINAGQAAGKTLTGAGNGGGSSDLTVEQYLAMSVDDIIKLKSTASGRAQLQAIGAL